MRSELFGDFRDDAAEVGVRRVWEHRLEAVDGVQRAVPVVIVAGH